MFDITSKYRANQCVTEKSELRFKCWRIKDIGPVGRERNFNYVTQLMSQTNEDY